MSSDARSSFSGDSFGAAFFFTHAPAAMSHAVPFGQSLRGMALAWRGATRPTNPSASTSRSSIEP
jgi:hypothetical protein